MCVHLSVLSDKVVSDCGFWFGFAIFAAPFFCTAYALSSFDKRTVKK